MNGLASWDLPPLLRAALSHPLLSAKEERALARRIRRGNRAAYERLFACNLRFVISIAKRYARRGVPFEDLFQAGCIGLHSAVRRYDHRRNTRFTTCAAFWIRHAISRSIHNTRDVVRLPVHVHEQIQKMTRAAERHSLRVGTDPSPAELAQAIGLPLRTVERLLADFGTVELAAANGRLSVDSSLLDEFEDTFIRKEQEQSAALNLIADLPPREREILLLRLRGWTYAQIGRRFEVSRERVSQLMEAILSVLADPARRPRKLSTEEIAYLRRSIRVAARARKNERAFGSGFERWIAAAEGALPAKSRRIYTTVRGKNHMRSRAAWIANRRRLGLADNGLLPQLHGLRVSNIPRLAEHPELRAAFLALCRLVRSPQSGFFTPWFLHRGPAKRSVGVLPHIEVCCGSCHCGTPKSARRVINYLLAAARFLGASPPCHPQQTEEFFKDASPLPRVDKVRSGFPGGIRDSTQPGCLRQRARDEIPNMGLGERERSPT